MTLPELIAALEAATGVSRELDGEIAMITGPWSKYDLGDNCWQWRFNDVNFGTRPPYYTQSVDAALTLVPEDMPAMVQRNPNDPHAALVGMSSKLEGRDTLVRGNGITPAIALCIAALKVRASKGK